MRLSVLHRMKERASIRDPARGSRRAHRARGPFATAVALCLWSAAPAPAQLGIAARFAANAAPAGQAPDSSSPSTSTLEEARLSIGKWLETQQVIAKERNAWLQGKDILLGRLALVDREIAALDEDVQAARATIAENDQKRAALLAESEQLEAVGAQLTAAVGAMETELRKLLRTLPEPIATNLRPLTDRMPEDPAQSRASFPERFQNVLVILNVLNKANGELTTSYEVRELADGRPSEVQVIYVGLAQAYYVSASGEAGIGWPEADGWHWEPSNAIAADVIAACEILQGKQTPAFVPLPAKLR